MRNCALLSLMGDAWSAGIPVVPDKIRQSTPANVTLRLHNSYQLNETIKMYSYCGAIHSFVLSLFPRSCIRLPLWTSHVFLMSTVPPICHTAEHVLQTFLITQCCKVQNLKYVERKREVIILSSQHLVFYIIKYFDSVHISQPLVLTGWSSHSMKSKEVDLIIIICWFLTYKICFRCINLVLVTCFCSSSDSYNVAMKMVE